MAGSPETNAGLSQQLLSQPNNNDSMLKNVHTNNKKEPIPRLVLTQIELINFKSYFGRRVIGPFHKRFSAIVGPNGSGKSNVIDALLFVFGRRAKQIRLKKISELVHSSENHKNCKQARVNVYFQEIIDNEDDEDDFELIPNSKLTISRVATKRSKSQYFINNKAVPFREVKQLLLTKNIDLNNNRFLILQGEVESIAMMKPKGKDSNDEGLLEYLEDIIGTNQYVEQIDKAAEQVDLLQNEVQERLNRVKVVERDRDKLSDAKGEAEEYIKSQLQLMKLQGVTKQMNATKWEYKLGALEKKLNQINQELDDKKGEQTSITQELETIESQYELILKEKEKLSKEWKTAQNTFQGYEEQDVSFTERLKYLKKQLNKIKKNRANLQDAKAKNQETISKNEASIPELKEQTELLQQKLEEESDKQEAMMNELTEKIAPIKEKMEEKQKELMPLKDKENMIKQKMDEINDDIKAIESKTENANTRKQDILKRMNDIDLEIQSKTADINHSQNEIEHMINDDNQFKNQLKRLQTESTEIGPMIVKAQKEFNDARYAFENAGSKGRISSKLMEAQQRSELSGILGRLGDLGSIDSKYDIAASTAGTGPLNYIVVDKTHHAQRAVEYLKRHNLGRATMLILEKQRHLGNKCRRGIDTPHNVPRLFDFINVKEDKYKEAFYFAFRDTLVAQDLNHANRLAFDGGKRWRVVTLQGQLIETSGAMTGGGSRVYKGLMSDRIMNDCEYTADDVKNLEIEWRNLQEKQQEIHKQLRDTQHKIHGCKKQLDKTKKKHTKMNVEWKGLKQRKQALSDQIPDIEAQGMMNQDDEQELMDLQVQNDRISKEFEAARRNCELLEECIANLEDEILAEGGQRLREQKGKVDKLKRKLKETEKKVTQMGVEIKKCNKALKTSDSKYEALTVNFDEMKTEYDDIKKKKRELTDKAADVLDLVETKKSEYDRKEKEWNKLSKIVEKQQTKLTKLTKDIMNLNESQKTANLETKKLVHMKKNIKKDINKLKERFVRHKTEFLDMDDGEDNDNNDNNGNNNDDEKAVTIQEIGEKNAMDVDSDDDDGDNEENAMDVDSDANNETKKEDEEDSDNDNAEGKIFDLNVYLSFTTLQFEMLTQSQLEDIDLSVIDKEIQELKKDIENSKVNMGAIQAWRMKDSEYMKKLQDLQSCKGNRDEHRKIFEDLKTARFDAFMSGFSVITKKLKEMYRMLTCGGDAELELVDSIDPFSEGVQFSVRPPKKSWKNISNLSGGEKTLSSMALVFALHHYKPTPLYVMDEIDAALDFKNVSIVANYIHQRTKNAQFVIISLRNNMFDLANRLVGIYKTDNASKSITINPKLFNMTVETNNNNNTKDHNHNHNIRNNNHNKSHMSEDINNLNIASKAATVAKEIDVDEEDDDDDVFGSKQRIQNETHEVNVDNRIE